MANPTLPALFSRADEPSREEKQTMDMEAKPVALSVPSDLESQLPDDSGGLRPYRRCHVFRTAVLNTYRRLFSVVFLGNLAGFIFILYRDRKTTDMLNIAAANLLVAGLVRQPFVVNLIYMLVASWPKSAPLWVRVRAARVFRMGAVHSGCAIASFMWYLGFLVLYTSEQMSALSEPRTATLSGLPAATLSIGYLIPILLLAVMVAAHPQIRRKRHDWFELTHRFGGWACVALFWALLFALVAQQTSAASQPSSSSSPLQASVGGLLVRTPAFWILIVTTCAIIHPWLLLRRVPVTPEVLSNHAIRLHFGHTTTRPTQGLPLARHPLRDWHSFATLTDRFDAAATRFSVVVSRAGDFTGDLIARPPTHLWTRGPPVSGFGHCMAMFGRVLVVATGSGVGPLLGFLDDDTRGAMRVVWQTRDPVATYGRPVLDLVRRIDPDPVLLDTTKLGRRVDMVPLVLRLYRDFEAEVVCIISNEKLTRKLVYECEARGVPAFGPTFDS